MTVEYSPGYKAAAQTKLDSMRKYMSPHPWTVATGLSDHFDHSSSQVSSKSLRIIEMERSLAEFYKACNDHDLAQEKS